ncbi:MAG: ureidoglycolate lyase [Gemmatimonadota bacterium]|nr:ureidoglycolate lyase [Gemmatimonadota bacterium]MDH3423226.1 ureidoglycolate lyase [Gemmatimonadota bacterium]
MRLIARAPDAGSFAPFGAFLQPPPGVGDRSVFSEWLEPVPGLSPSCYLNRVPASTLPFTVERVERHPNAAQLFLPVGVSRYLVTVMPPDEAGAPDPAGALAVVVPGTVGVVYHPGVWHAGIVALDAESSFAVLMWRGGAEDDVFAPIAPLEVHGGPGHG